MQLFNKPYLKALVIGTLVALTVLGVGFLFLDRDECPANYSQQQIDTAGCIVGANIGLGIVLLLSAAIQLATLLLSLIIFITKKK
jgi:hypothetical protein